MCDKVRIAILVFPAALARPLPFLLEGPPLDIGERSVDARVVGIARLDRSRPLRQLVKRGLLVRGLAPFLELHYNTTNNGADSIQAGAFTIAPNNNHFDELNLSFGAITQIRDNFLLYAGAVVPLLGQNHRTFDYQIGLHGTLLFGPTGRNRSSQISSF